METLNTPPQMIFIRNPKKNGPKKWKGMDRVDFVRLNLSILIKIPEFTRSKNDV